MIEIVKKHMLADDGKAIYTLSEDDKKTPVSMKQILSEVLEAMPKDKKIILGENLHQEDGETPDADEKAPGVIVFGDKEIDINDPERIAKNMKKALKQ